jgi:hypothetical protein
MLNRRPPACTVAISWLHRYFTGIYQLLLCQTVVRPPWVGATSALLRDTPGQNRESPYPHLGHSQCQFTTVSLGGLTVERRIMPEELRCCPGSPRNTPALVSLPVCPDCIKILNTTGATPQWLPVQHGLSRFNSVHPDSIRFFPASLRLWCPNRDAPGIYTGTVWTRLCRHVIFAHWSKQLLTLV